jgi:hypothetical protein
MTASVLYVAYIQACWAVLSAVLLATVLAMLLAVLFLSGLAAIIRTWRWRA